MNKRKTGADKEQLACEYLKMRGMRIVEQNFRCRMGEIDIVGYHNGYLVFVEVKYRSNTLCGTAFEAVDYRKQCQICKVADYYRMIHRKSNNTCVRYDVVAIQGEDISWMQNAFSHIYRTGM